MDKFLGIFPRIGQNFSENRSEFFHEYVGKLISKIFCIPPKRVPTSTTSSLGTTSWLGTSSSNFGQHTLPELSPSLHLLFSSTSTVSGVKTPSVPTNNSNKTAQSFSGLHSFFIKSHSSKSSARTESKSGSLSVCFH
jgi:hypothetical protein